MKPKPPRIPFDHIKDIYGDKLEKYSYQEVERNLLSTEKALRESNNGRGRYEDIRRKVLDFVLLAFILLMLAAGLYFILTGIVST